MLQSKRDDLILREIRLRGTTTAQELSSLLDVSASTVRRDLERLDREGRLNRVYGGAMPLKGPAEASFAETVDEYGEEKDAIAAAAAALVQDGEVVLLDIGTTTMRIARQLRGRPITVITSSLTVLDVLRDDPEVRLVMLGGIVRRNYQTQVGSLTEDAVRSVTADRLFLSCTGIRQDGAVVDDMTVEASVKRGMVSVAESVVLVASRNKFPGTGSLRICSLERVSTLVTNTGADQRTMELCRQHGGKVIEA